MKSKRKLHKYGRYKILSTPSTNSCKTIQKELKKKNIKASPIQVKDFLDNLSGYFEQHQNSYIDAQNNAIKRLENIQINIPNGIKGKKFSYKLVLPNESSSKFELEGLNDTGLEIIRGVEGNTFIIQGIPIFTGDVNFRIKYKFKGWRIGEQIPEREIGFAINPDPRTLWRNIETSPDIEYPKPDTACEFIKVDSTSNGQPRKDIVAASIRGRSHAHEGRPRDDHFSIFHNNENDWYILVVADGAGSAKYSRKGSWKACDTVMEFCKQQLENNKDFEKAIREYNDVKENNELEPRARKIVGDLVYGIVAQAAFQAHRAIIKTAEVAQNCTPKDFATTLLLSICKKFDFGWFIASFWVGDGAMCVYDKDSQTISILGTPDEGEYSGQTRFITMPEIFKDPSDIYKRLRFGIKDNFTALMLMTDGVSDPMFGTDANLNDITKWNELWDKLQNGFPEDGIPGVDLNDDNDQSKDQLLNWLNFWMPGEHDDRTIAILY